MGTKGANLFSALQDYHEVKKGIPISSAPW